MFGGITISDIDNTDLVLLIALQKMPLGSYSNLAMETGVCAPTVRNRLERLKTKKVYFRVSAILNHEALGLEIVDYLLYQNNLSQIEQLENILDNHPYILYRSRIVGPRKGLYVQFRIPTNSQMLIDELLFKLKKLNYISDYFNLKTSGNSIYSTCDLDAWNKLTWIFDWNAWYQKKITLAELPTYDNEIILSKLDKIDLQLLRYLTKDARIRQMDIARELNIPPYTLTRKRKFLQDTAIIDYRVFLGWRVFNIFNSILLIVRTEPDKSREFALRIHEHHIPFQSTFRFTESGFMWYIALPQDQMSDFMTELWKHFVDFDLYWMDYKSSETYIFWPETFDLEKKRWKTSKKFLIDDVISI